MTTVDFVPGQLTFQDRSVPLDNPHGTPTPFDDVTAHRKIVGLSAYAPAANLAPKNRHVKIKDLDVELLMLPSSYTHLYVTSIDPVTFLAQSAFETEIVVVYQGRFRLSYHVTPAIVGALPSVHAVEFKAVAYLNVRRSPQDHYESFEIRPERDTILFPGAVFTSDGAFYFRCSWPTEGDQDITTGLHEGFLFSATR